MKAMSAETGFAANLDCWLPLIRQMMMIVGANSLIFTLGFILFVCAIS